VAVVRVDLGPATASQNVRVWVGAPAGFTITVIADKPILPTDGRLTNPSCPQMGSLLFVFT